MAEQLGGRVGPGREREYGPAAIAATGESPLFAGLPAELDVWMSHGDRIEELPPGFAPLAASANSPVAVMADAARGYYGLQFHPEVAHTPRGADILANFAHGVCGAAADWTPGDFIAETVDAIRARVGGGRAVCGLSGGVDSAVAATLVHRAIGDRLTCLFVDNGLLRAGEAEEVEATFRRELRMDLRVIDARERFLTALAEVTNPETKRIRIGAAFIEAFEAEARTIADARFLCQGTLYPDVIESASHGAGSARIKSHHNVGGLPERMDLKLVEPLRFLFKDEVRRIGAELGLPDEILWRQPFPGPGLAVRVIGEVTAERLAVLRAADAIFAQEVRAAGLGTRPLAELRRAHGHAHRGRDGRLPHLRPRHRPARRGRRGRHDGGLGAPAPRPARARLQPHRQRGRRRQPRRLRHHQQAAGDDRVGVSAPRRHGGRP